MDIPIYERRQIENEMIFRRANEKVADDLESLDDAHIHDDNIDLVWDDTVQLNFKCECSDEDCDQRIPIKLSRYKEIHLNRKAFIVKPGHQVDKIEVVIATEKNYNIVEKNKSVAEPGNKLNDTAINNTNK